jgi:hypothetical protein
MEITHTKSTADGDKVQYRRTIYILELMTSESRFLLDVALLSSVAIFNQTTGHA